MTKPKKIKAWAVVDTETGNIDGVLVNLFDNEEYYAEAIFEKLKDAKRFCGEETTGTKIVSVEIVIKK